MISIYDNQLSFSANIPKTEGKNVCNHLAKKLLYSDNKADIKFAQDYFQSIQKIKKEKAIKEVLIVYPDFYQAKPKVICNGDINCFQNSAVNVPEHVKEKNGYILMSMINDVANHLNDIVLKHW